MYSLKLLLLHKANFGLQSKVCDGSQDLMQRNMCLNEAKVASVEGNDLWCVTKNEAIIIMKSSAMLISCNNSNAH